MKPFVFLLVLLSIVTPCYTACVSSFSSPIGNGLCRGRNFGTVKFTLLTNGKLQIQITLATGFTLRGWAYSTNPMSSDPSSSSYTQVPGSTTSATTSDSVCGKTVKIAVAIFLVDADGATCTFWATKGDVDFQTFKTNGFSGISTAMFCPCTPTPCCNTDRFTFDCKNLQFCPAGNPFKDPQTGNNMCYCGDISGGGIACLADRGTCDNAVDCTTNADCQQGLACQLNSCCNDNKGNPRSICVQLCQDRFPTAAPCIQPPVQRTCCNPQGFQFDCANLKFCPQTNPLKSPQTGANQCYCGSVAGNSVACLADRGTCDNTKDCTKNGDCPVGQACQLKSCCKSGANARNICVPFCQTQFPSSAHCEQPTSPPACCNATNFVFRCPAGCSPAAGKTCPPTGALSFCPASNPFTDTSGLKCYCGNVLGGGIACLKDLGSCSSVQECKSNGDCDPGSLCQQQSCCGGKDICVPKCPSPTECQNVNI